jgi:hypothetical protein
MSNSNDLPIALPIAQPVVQTHPDKSSIEESPESFSALNEFQPMPIVPSQMVLCRSCNKSFLRHEGDRGSSRYYRCRDCVGTEALMLSLMYSCTVS